MASAERAVQQGDTNALRALLEEHPHLATAKMEANPVTLLYDVGVNCVVRSYPNAVESASLLIDAGAGIIDPLWAAACVGAIPILELLAERGAPIDGGERPWTPMDESLYWGHTEAAVFLRERGAPIRWLRTAAGLGDLEALEGFFDGVELRPNAGTIASPFGDAIPDHGSTDPRLVIDNALMFATMNGQIDAAEQLLIRDARPDVIAPGAHHGATPLHCAAWKGPVAMVEFLIDNGADPNAKDAGEGDTPLDWARFYKRHDVVDFLETR
ncbi:MAG: ankyrin repeat domain-containing protein [Planctomycetota bacterium]